MAEETAAPADGATAPAAKPKLVMVLAIAFAGISSGGAAGAFVAGPMIAKQLVPPPAAHAESGHSTEGGAGGEHGKAGEKSNEAEGGTSLLLDNLVLNPAGSGGGRYLLVSVSIRYGNLSLKEKFTAREAEIRDAILHILGTKPVEQLTDMAARELIKDEIKTVVDGIMGPKTVFGVFFPQFVIQ